MHIKACIFHGYELHSGSAAVDMFSCPNGVVLICPHISLEGSVPSTCRTSSKCQGDGALTCTLAVADAFADIGRSQALAVVRLAPNLFVNLLTWANLLSLSPRYSL